MEQLSGANKKLIILLIEDSTMDAELLHAYLSEFLKSDFEMDIVALKSDFLSAISSKQYDLILSDFNLPDFNGFIALEHANLICPTTPFIVVSSMIGEITAVELLKHGATDYILKDKLGRLNNSIERAISEANEKIKNKKIEKQFYEEHKILLESQRIAKLGTWSLKVNTNEIFWTDQVYKIFGLDSSIEPPILTEHKRLFTTESWKRLSESINLAVNKGIPYNLELETRLEDGTNGWMSARGEAEQDDDGNIVMLWGTAQDITARVLRLKEIEFVSSHDGLTKLPNRRYYYEQIEHLNTNENHPLGIMMFDINGLKLINDAFGHSIGDGVIINSAKILQETIGKEGFLARIGGDEFAAILPNTSIEKLQNYKYGIFNSMKAIKINNVELSIAIGYELKKSVGEDVADSIKIAENLMYRHKIAEGKSVRSRSINAILKTLTDKYSLEKNHSLRVSELCKSFGEQLNLMRSDEIKELEMAGLFHDIGKISIPDNILYKPRKLTFEEYDVIKTHVEVGYQILRAADEYSEMAIHALHHHEHWDGNGYPSGLKGNDIPFFSRIICIIDAFDAMTSDRPYRKKMSVEDAILEIKSCSGTHFDPKLVNTFIEKVVKQ